MSKTKRDPPISNEELYLELKETKYNQRLVMGLMLGAAGLVGVGVNDPRVVLIGFSGMVLYAAVALGTLRRSRLTWLASLFEDDDIDETIEEARGRLTDSARTDGRGTGGDER